MIQRGLIAIAGNVGVGKTTLAENLASELGAGLIREEYDQNPFLADQVSGKTEVSLSSELFFLFSRVRQLRKDRIETIGAVVCDYTFDKNRIFARLNLGAKDYESYCRLEQTVEPYIAPPNVVIYLQGDIETCLERIARRGRSFETGFTAETLRRLHDAYEQLFSDWGHCPVVRLDAGSYDFRRRSDVQEILSTKFYTHTD